MTTEALARLYAFAQSECRFDPRKTQIQRDSSLIDDLQLDGDDAFEFMQHFFAHFGVAYGDYNPNTYFYQEGLNLFAFIPLIFSKKARAKDKREPLTLGTLEHAIRSGTFDSAAK